MWVPKIELGSSPVEPTPANVKDKTGEGWQCGSAYHLRATERAHALGQASSEVGKLQSASHIRAIYVQSGTYKWLLLFPLGDPHLLFCFCLSSCSMSVCLFVPGAGTKPRA